MNIHYILSRCSVPEVKTFKLNFKSTKNNFYFKILICTIEDYFEFYVRVMRYVGIGFVAISEKEAEHIIVGTI